MNNIRDSEKNRQPRHGPWRYVWIGLAGIIVVAACGITIKAVYNYKSIKSIDNDFTPAQISIAVQENDNNNEKAVYISPDSGDDSLTWKLSSDSNTYTTDKEVTVKNLNVATENNADAYVRVAMIPRWIRRVYIDETGQMYDAIPTTETSSGGEANSTDDTASEEPSTAVEHTYTEQDIDVMSANYKSFGQLTDIKIKDDNTFVMGDVTFVLNADWEKYWVFNPKDGYFYYKSALPPESKDDEGNVVAGITQPLLEKVSISADTYKTVNTDGLYLRVDILADAIQTEGNAVTNRWASSGITINSETEQLELNTATSETTTEATSETTTEATDS
jgi:hypothetical protein